MEFPGGPVVSIPGSALTRVQSLARKLRSQPHSVAKKKMKFCLKQRTG